MVWLGYIVLTAVLLYYKHEEDKKADERRYQERVQAMLIGQGFSPYGTLYQLQLLCFPIPINQMLSPGDLEICQSDAITEYRYQVFVDQVKAKRSTMGSPYLF